jgi:hypothetical protein
MLHRGHRTWTPYVDPHPDKENALSGLPLKTPIRHAGQLGGGKHHTTNGKASLLGGKQAAPLTGNGKATGSSLLGKGRDAAGGVEAKRIPMTVFKDRNLVLTGKKNGVSMRGSGEEGGEGDTFGRPTLPLLAYENLVSHLTDIPHHLSSAKRYQEAGIQGRRNHINQAKIKSQSTSQHSISG